MTEINRERRFAELGDLEPVAREGIERDVKWASAFVEMSMRIA